MNTTASMPTLQQLVLSRMKEKGLSRSQIIRSMGLTNISKGLRRLDHFLQTLEYPSDEFVVRLLSVLDINGLEFCRAVTSTQSNMSESNRKVFTPYIRIQLGVQIRGAFAWQMVMNKCTTRVSEDIQALPFARELDAVIKAYTNHRDAQLADSSLIRHVTGFRYYRAHNYSLHFDADLVLRKIEFLAPSPSGRLPLANRLVNVLMGGGAQ